MSLAFGTGPLTRNGGRWSFEVPDHVWYLEDWPRRLRAVLAGETVLDTRRAKLLHESGRLPVHYIPLDDIDPHFLDDPEQPAGDPDGSARRYDVRVGDRLAPRAVTVVSAPRPGAPPLANHATVEFAAMDRWFEEDDPIYAHPRDPYHRVDVRASSRHVIVRHRGQVIAETRRPKLLFETANPVRHYLPVADVRLDLLERSTTISECPYKGDGQHWHLDLDDERIEDAAWSLPHPLPEGLPAAEHICFYPSKVETVVDSRRLDEPW